MEILNQLTKLTTKQSRRVGRGIGSCKGGHTTGKGSKGDKIRGKTKITFDGTKIKKGWIKRLPFLRGKHRLLARESAVLFNFNHLEKWFKKDELVSPETLSKKSGLHVSKLSDVKILATGKLTKTLNFSKVSLSSKAGREITALGGKITND
jgi:large subunit ribosomal protein L15